MKTEIVEWKRIIQVFSVAIISTLALALAGAVQASAEVIGGNLLRGPGNNDPSYVQCTGSQWWEESDCDYYTDWYAVGSRYEITFIVAAAPGAQVATTAPGIATKGVVRTNGPRTVNVRIVRPEGGLVYKVIGESGFHNVGPGISEIPMHVGVQPGDMVAVSATRQNVSKTNPASFESRTPGAFAYVKYGSSVPVGVSATYEGENKTEPLVQAVTESDLDGDGLGDITQDPDTDNDGLTNDIEAKWGTNSFDVDSDDDGLRDGEEDRNHNGTLDSYKRINNTKICKKAKKRKKGKKRSKKANVAKKKKKKKKKRKKFKPFKKKYIAKIETDPRKADTDGDKLPDGLEIGVIAPIPVAGAILGTDKPITLDAHPSSVTNPRSKDTDGDGIRDGKEDRNKDGKYQKTKKKGKKAKKAKKSKKRETNPNRPDCSKKKAKKKKKKKKKKRR